MLSAAGRPRIAGVFAVACRLAWGNSQPKLSGPTGHTLYIRYVVLSSFQMECRSSDIIDGVDIGALQGLPESFTGKKVALANPVCHNGAPLQDPQLVGPCTISGEDPYIAISIALHSPGHLRLAKTLKGVYREGLLEANPSERKSKAQIITTVITIPNHHHTGPSSSKGIRSTLGPVPSLDLELPDSLLPHPSLPNPDPAPLPHLFITLGRLLLPGGRHLNCSSNKPTIPNICIFLAAINACPNTLARSSIQHRSTSHASTWNRCARTAASSAEASTTPPARTVFSISQSG